METTNAVLDILISLIKGAKSQWSGLQCDYEGQHYTLWGCSYLLDQALRLYQIPDDHYLISEKAKDLWTEITTKPIKDFNYQRPVTYEFKEPLEAKCFTGNGNGFSTRTLKQNDSFPYRDVFHDDHVVPLKIIIQELVNLDEIDFMSWRRASSLSMNKIKKAYLKVLAINWSATFEVSFFEIWMPR